MSNNEVVTSELPVDDIGTYYSHVRKDIAPVLPRAFNSVLDIGCGEGVTSAWLKSEHPHIKTTGVELDKGVAPRLVKNVDEMYIGDFTSLSANLGTFDLILLLDVLEHLENPVEALEACKKLLRPGGSVVISLPNVAHVSVSLPLLLSKKFEYADAGILDRTHLRFFTEASALELLKEAGFTVRDAVAGGMNARKYRWTNALSGGLFRGWLAKQLLMRGDLSGAPSVARWR